MKRDRLFTYGTLVTAARHPLGDLVREKARFVGAGSICARLYLIDDPEDPGANFFPGALPSPDPADRVFGEIYDVIDPDPLYAALDDFEACGPAWPEPQEFILRSVEVVMDNGESTRAVAYLYSWDVTGARRIQSGRWTEVSPDVR